MSLGDKRVISQDYSLVAIGPLVQEFLRGVRGMSLGTLDPSKDKQMSYKSPSRRRSPEGVEYLDDQVLPRPEARDGFSGIISTQIDPKKMLRLTLFIFCRYSASASEA